MKMTQLTVAACAALLASSVAMAAGPLKFKKADVDGDKALSMEEFKNSGAKAKFKKLDKNKDGVLSRKEYDVIFEEDCE